MVIGYFMSLSSYYTGLALVTGLVSLYFYSKKLKGTIMFGNLLIAALSSLVVVILLISELPWRGGEALLHRITQIIVAFSLFAFLSSLLREIVKDIEDIEGDRQADIRTIATVYGVSKSGWVALFISAILLSSLILASVYEWEGFSLFGQFYAVLLILFLSAIMIQIYRSTNPRDFRRISMVLKVFMAAGLFFVIFWNV